MPKFADISKTMDLHKEESRAFPNMVETWRYACDLRERRTKWDCCEIAASAGATLLRHLGELAGDQIAGMAGSDVLLGGGGGEYRDGENGDDVMVGGNGSDTLSVKAREEIALEFGLPTPPHRTILRGDLSHQNCVYAAAKSDLRTSTLTSLQQIKVLNRAPP